MKCPLCGDRPLTYMLSPTTGDRRRFSIYDPWEGRQQEVDLLACTKCGFCAIMMNPARMRPETCPANQTMWDKIGDESGET